MAGGVMQLIAYGGQDMYLSSNPSVTFFKTVYKRHTNFSMEQMRINFESIANFQPAQKTTLQAKINRHGDLIHDMYLVYDLPNIFSTELEKFQWVKNLGENIIHTAEITIGGHRIDIQYGQWLNIWNQLVLTSEKKRSYNRMIGNTTDVLYPLVYRGEFATNRKPTIPARRLYIPLNFWFCQNSGLALPLIAIQYHEVHINIEFNELNRLFTLINGYSPTYVNEKLCDLKEEDKLSEDLTILKNDWEARGFNQRNLFWKYVNGTDTDAIWAQNVYLDVNFIFLDTDERRKFAKQNHEYLITQVQRNEFQGLNGPTTVDLTFHHPVKELYTVFMRSDIDERNQWNNYTNCTVDIENDFRDYNLNTRQHIIDFANCDDDNCLETVLPSDEFTELTKEIVENELFDNDCMQNMDTDTIIGHTNRDIMLSAKLLINGYERFAERDAVYFSALQHYKYHSGSGNTGIYTYSFAMKPEDIQQPSGTLNFSRVNKARFEFRLKQIPRERAVLYDGYVYAVNYNVLRITSGLAGLAFVS